MPQQQPVAKKKMDEENSSFERSGRMIVQPTTYSGHPKFDCAGKIMGYTFPDV